MKAGVYVSSGESPYITPLSGLIDRETAAMAAGARVRRGPAPRRADREAALVIPAVVVIGLAAFVIGVFLTGSSIETAREEGWLLGPLDGTLWRTWTLRAVAEADWLAVLGQWAAIVTAVSVAVIAILFNVGGAERVLDRDLDTNGSSATPGR